MAKLHEFIGNYFLKIFISGFLCGSCEVISSQSFPELNFKTIIPRTSDRSNYVQAIHKDALNVLWIGCSSGLHSYDGVNVRNHPTGSNETGNKGINNIIEDAEHNLWMGTSLGLLYYERKTGKFNRIFYNRTTKGSEFTSAYFIDDRNKLWFHSAVNFKLVTYDLATHVFDSISNATSDRLIFYPNEFYKPVSFIISAQLPMGIEIFEMKNGSVSKRKVYFKGDKKGFPEAKISKGILIENAAHIWMPSNFGLILFSKIDEKWKVFSDFKGAPIKGLENVARINSRFLALQTREEGLYIFDKIEGKIAKNFRHLESNPFSIQSNTSTMVRTFDSTLIFMGGMGSGLDMAVIPNTISQVNSSAQISNLPLVAMPVEHITALSETDFIVADRRRHLFVWNPASKLFTEPVRLQVLNKTINNQKINGLYKNENGGIFILGENNIWLLNKDFSFRTVSSQTGATGMAAISAGRYLFLNESILYEVVADGEGYFFRNVPDYTNRRQRAGNRVFVNKEKNRAYTVSEWG